MQPEKPGYLTTEFWVSTLTVAAILLKLFGIDLNTDDINALALGIAGMVGGAFAVWGIVARYVTTRANLKQTVATYEIAKVAAKGNAPYTLSLGGK